MALVKIRYLVAHSDGGIGTIREVDEAEAARGVASGAVELIGEAPAKSRSTATSKTAKKRTTRTKKTSK